MQYIKKSNQIEKTDGDFNIKTLINANDEILDFSSLERDDININKIYSKIIFNNILSAIIYTPSLNENLQSIYLIFLI